MKARNRGLFGLALLIGLGALMPLLSGCQQEEKKNDPNYYTGTDFKGHNPSQAGSETAAKKKGE